MVCYTLYITNNLTLNLTFSRFPLFVLTWWITGTMAIACYTAAFVWTMEMAAGKWKIYIGMSMNYSWPICRLIIAGSLSSILKSCQIALN